MEAKEVLIRLLKEEVISVEDFDIIYSVLVEKEPVIKWNREYPQQPMPVWQDRYPLIWHGINDPSTGEPLGPTYST